MFYTQGKIHYNPWIPVVGMKKDDSKWHRNLGLKNQVADTESLKHSAQQHPLKHAHVCDDGCKLDKERPHF